MVDLLIIHNISFWEILLKSCAKILKNVEKKQQKKNSETVLKNLKGII